MTTILPRSVDLSKGIDVRQNFRVGKPSDAELARVAKLQADAKALTAESVKRNEMAVKGGQYENHDVMIFGPKETSPEAAKSMLDRVKVMVAAGETKGPSFHARWGDRVATDVKTYTSWLEQSIALGKSITPASDNGQSTTKSIK